MLSQSECVHEITEQHVCNVELEQVCSSEFTSVGITLLYSEGFTEAVGLILHVFGHFLFQIKIY
jgi:hypothetical protein